MTSQMTNLGVLFDVQQLVTVKIIYLMPTRFFFVFCLIHSFSYKAGWVHKSSENCAILKKNNGIVNHSVASCNG